MDQCVYVLNLIDDNILLLLTFQLHIHLSLLNIEISRKSNENICEEEENLREHNNFLALDSKLVRCASYFTASNLCLHFVELGHAVRNSPTKILCQCKAKSEFFL